MLTRISCVLLASIGSLALLHAQTPRPEVGSSDTPNKEIHGRVVQGDTGAAAARTEIVAMSTDGSLRRTTVADDQGRYALTGLPPGRFLVSATKPGFVTVRYGQQRFFEAGNPLDLTVTRVLRGVDLTIPRGGAITGRVVDEFGEPVTGLQVQVQRHRFLPGGERRLLPVSSGVAFPFFTDDRGEFRVFGLPAGSYVVGAMPRPAVPPTRGAPSTGRLLPTFYPGTLNPSDAQSVVVTPGQEAWVQFAVLVGGAARVAGIVLDSTGNPAISATITISSQGEVSTPRIAVSRTAPDGSFALTDVTPGSYHIVVTASSGKAHEFAAIGLEVSTDVEGLRISTSSGTSVRGRIQWPTGSARSRGQLRVEASTVGPSAPQASGSDGGGVVDDNGSFQLTNLFGSVIFRVQGTDSRWVMKTVLLNGQDVTDSPVEVANFDSTTQLRIVLTDQAPVLTGSVSDAIGAPLSRYVAVVVPDRPTSTLAASRFVRTARPDQNGVFRIEGLPNGSYTVAALSSLEEGAEWDPQLQELVRRTGQRIELVDRGTHLLQLRLTEQQ